MKVLFVATIAEHFLCFHLPYFGLFKEKGWEVEAACCEPVSMPGCDQCHRIDIARSPFMPRNIKGFLQLKKLLNKNKYDIVHCNTPMGGALARLAAGKVRKRGTKVVYTAHGFHFFMGAPLKNWLVYYPIEFLLAGRTDCLITINEEDYRFATKRLKPGKTVRVHGVGFDADKFQPASAATKQALRRENGYRADDILLVYVAELNGNKNQGFLIKAMKTAAAKNKKVKLLLIGPDSMAGKYKQMAAGLGLDENVKFYGMRTDVDKLLPMCDIAVASSLREGLPVNIMEALACGLPVVAVDNRGHRELVRDGVNGYLVAPGDTGAMVQRVFGLIDDKQLYRKLSEAAVNSVTPFCRERVVEEMRAVYDAMC